jgi:hypothetical protein
MHEITSHKVNGLNEAISIRALDDPGAGNACHEYRLAAESDGSGFCYELKFQNGPISESGINGISNEALLAIVEHRLQGFQSGQYSCRENALALTHVQDAMHWLHHRTRERVARGVEGTSNK